MDFGDDVSKWEEAARDTHVQVYGVRLQVLIHVVKIATTSAPILIVAKRVVIVCMEHQRALLGKILVALI